MDRKKSASPMLDKVFSFLPSLPAGFGEMAALPYLARHVDSGLFSAIVVDTAPTGHTLQMFKSSGLIGAVKQHGIFDMVSKMLDHDGAQAKAPEVDTDFVHDATRCTFICVCIAEFLSVFETERLVSDLHELKIDVGGIIVNRMVKGGRCTLKWGGES